MPIAVASVTGYDFDTDVTSHSCLITATVNANDILLAVMAFDLTVTITASGWSDEGVISAGADNPTAKCFALRASGSEGGTNVDFVTNIAERGGVIIYRITGAYRIGAVSNAIEIAAVDNTGSPADPPNLTPTWGAKENLWIVTAAHSVSSAFAVTTAPTNYGSFTQGGSFPITGSSDAAVYSAHRILNAASENPGAFADGNGHAATIAVRPDDPKAAAFRRRATRIINRRNFR